MATFEMMSLLRSEETETVVKSREDFAERLNFVESISELFLQTARAIDSTVQNLSVSHDAAYMIGFRIFRTVRCSLKAALEGYYEVSMALLRVAYENNLLMVYLTENEEKAKLWFEGKRFPPYLLRQNVSYSSNSMYQKMSEFIHSSFKSSLSFTVIEEANTKATIGEYNRDQFSRSLLLILMIMATTMSWLFIKLAQELVDNEEWHSMFKATVPKIWRSLKQIVK